MRYDILYSTMNNHNLKDVFDENPDIQVLLEDFEKTKLEILSLEPFRKGSILKRWQTCRKPTCLCKKDKTFHNWPYFSWTLKHKQKTVSIVIPEAFLAQATQYIQNARSAEKTIQKLSDISEKIVQKQIQLTRQFLKNSKI